MSPGQPPTVEDLTELLAVGDGQRLQAVLQALEPGESARLVTRLDRAEQGQLLALLPAEDAALLLRSLSLSPASELLRLLTPEQAAAVLERFPSNEQADMLAELGSAAAEIAALLPAEMAAQVQKLRAYPADTAGGLMVAEYLAYREQATVADVIGDLREHVSRYSRFQVQYAYVTDHSDRLIGVLRLRDLLLLERSDPISKAMVRDPRRVTADMPLDQLLRFFDRHPFFGVPVVDGEGRLLGVVLHADVEEALSERADRRLLLTSGVLGGEELRSMNWRSRMLRRSPWLGISLLLSLTAASVIGWYGDTLSAVIALAVFLPVISGMGGNAGNQALAVSIRELSLGLVQPSEFTWVAWKEATVGMTNGVLVGAALAGLAYLWEGNLGLSMAIGLAISVNTALAACLGGVIPLALKRLGWDPALASGPILFTTIDLCGFLLTLSLADALMPWMA